MKTKLMIGIVTLFSAGVFAQEFDDMYFRAKDRVSTPKVNNTNEVYASSSYETFKQKNFTDPTMLDEYRNPTDTYSARNINPEFISRSYSEQASEDEQNYFVEGYASANAANTFNYNSGYYYNGWNSNPNTAMNMYNPGW